MRRLREATEADTAPQVGDVYPGLVPQPAEYEPFLAGIPRLHYPLPDDQG